MADEKKKAAVDFVRLGYEVQQTSNGGFFICLLRGYSESGFVRMYSTDSASFTNSTDFLAWLSAGHAAFDKEIVR